MSVRKEKFLTLASLDFENKTTAEIGDLCKQILKNGMHGLYISANKEDEKLGNQISEQQIYMRMQIIKPYTKWIRSFSCTDGNEAIPLIAKEYGIKMKCENFESIKKTKHLTFPMLYRQIAFYFQNHLPIVF